MRSAGYTLIALILLGSTAFAAPVVVSYGPFDVTFYNNGDSNGSTTSGQDWTAEQMNDVAASIEAWDSRINNTHGRQIKLDALWIEFDSISPFILGGSYSPSNGDGTTSWNYGEHVWRDSNNYTGPWTGFDTIIQYDITAGTAQWNFGDDDPTGSEIDFRSVVTHELGHSLGFSATYDSNPSFDDWGNVWGTASNPYAWVDHMGLSMWDKNLIDGSGNQPESGSTGTPGNFNQTDNPVYWTGNLANTYNGGPVDIYAPSPYQSGSSLSHLNQATHAAALMSPFISTGIAPRSPSELEWYMMEDMGWDIQFAAIPLPGSGLLLAGGMLVFACWRRRRTQ